MSGCPTSGPCTVATMYSQSSQTCRFYLRGACKHGNQCRYSHSAPDTAVKSKSFGGFATSTCSFFLQGRCRNGSACRFLHPQIASDATPGQTPTSSIHRSPSTMKTPTCSPTQGTAKVSDSRSGLRQDVAHAVERPVFGPCKFFVQGRCTKGETCPFPHIASSQSKPTHVDFVIAKPKPVTITAEPILPVSEIISSTDDTDRSSVPEKLTDIETEETQKEDQPQSHFVDRIKYGCKVLYGPGASIAEITTAFESRNLILSNLSQPLSSAKFTEFVETFGDIQSLIVSPGDSATARVEYADARRAVAAMSKLQDYVYEGRRIMARMDVRAVEDGRATLRSTKVKISWFAPSRIAWAHYDGLSFARKQAVQLNGKTFNGRKVTTTFQTPGRRQTESFSVEIKGLPPRIVSAHLRGFCDADAITLGRASYEMEHCAPRIRQLLAESGAIDSFDMLVPDPARPKVVAFAQFATADAAESAVRRFNGEKQSFLGRSPLWLEHIHTIKYTLPFGLFSILQAEIDTHRDSQECKVRYYDKDEDGEQLDPVCVRVYSSEPKALGKLKVKLDGMFAGELLVDDGGVRVWDAYFASAEGMFFLRVLSQRTGTFLQCEPRLRTIRLFGSEASRTTAKASVLQKTADIESSRHTIPLGKLELRILVTGGFAKLGESVGDDKVLLDVAKRSLIVRANGDELRKIQETFTALVSGRSDDATSETEECCPVCFCDATDPVRMPCGHVYCKACLQHYLRSPPSTKFDAMKCIAESEAGSTPTGSCNVAIPSSVIRDLLTPGEEDELLDASFLSHIHALPEEFHYCPTPDCQTIYRTSSDGTVLRCPTCLARVCASCDVEFHEGLTCAEFKGGMTEDTLAYNKWREENGVKACPRCQTDIVKDGGCNHMTCTRCGGHICWVCMQMFADEDSGKGVYAHMAREHGGSFTT